jgi:septal ring factor EnvC (AmiA/AmiB activator)
LDVQFTTSIEHISSQLVTQEESLTAQDAENKELRDKLNQFEEHMLLRSQHYAAQLKAKELELQLEDAKCAQQNHLYQQTANKLESKSAKLTAVQSSNEEMMTQLTMYAEKFEMFEEALTRSTSMFEQFEHKIKDLDEKLEKINEEKRLRNDICRKLDLTLFGIIDSKSKPDKEVEEALSVKESLQNECRRLQQARTEMLQRQKNAKSESPQV